MRVGSNALNPGTQDPPDPPKGGTIPGAEVLIEERYTTAHGRNRRRLVAVDLDAVRAELADPTTIDCDDWSQFRDAVALIVGETVFEVWFAPLTLAGVDRSGALTAVGPQATRSWFLDRFGDVIAKASERTGRLIAIADERQSQAIQASERGAAVRLTVGRLGCAYAPFLGSSPSRRQVVQTTQGGRLMLLALANQKGGVGKTTTAVNLAACVGRRGGRVLAVDCDPQSTMTRQLGIEGWLAVTLVDVLAGRAGAVDAVVSHVAPGVDAIPAARELSGVEMALVGELGRERFLADALEPLTAGYDLVVIDTPPNLGLLTVNALICADVVLAPVSCEDEASVQGLVELRATLAKLGRLRSTEPQLSTVLTRWAPGRVLSAVIDAAVAELGLPALARVPARAAVGLAGAQHVPLALAAPDSCVTIAHERLAAELVPVSAR